MGHGASVGWIPRVALAGALAALACGGNSENRDADEGPSDDGLGGSSGSSSGGASNGGTGSGGSAPTGGVSQGGSISQGGSTSQGGTSAVGGTSSVGGTGMGGTTGCSECPDASYGLVIEGDDFVYWMPFTGFIAPPGTDPVPCETPLRGVVGGCARTINVSACQFTGNGPPCIEIGGDAVRYLSLAGELLTGRVTSDVPRATSIPGVTSGTFTIELTNATGETFALTVGYTFCAPFGNLRIVC